MYPVAFKSAAPIHVAIRIMKVGSDSETVADCLRSISVWFFFAPSRLRVRPEDAVIDRTGGLPKIPRVCGAITTHSHTSWISKEAHGDEHRKDEEDEETNLCGFGVAEGRLTVDLTGLSVDQDAVGLLAIVVDHDPDRKQHWLTGQRADGDVDTHIASAPWEVARAGCRLPFFDHADRKWLGEFPRQTKLFDNHMLQIDILGRHCFAEVKGSDPIDLFGCQYAAGPYQDAVVVGLMLAADRDPATASSVGDLGGIAGPERIGVGGENPEGDVDLGDFVDRRTAGRVAWTPESVSQKLSQNLRRFVVGDAKRHHPAGPQGADVLLLAHLRAAAERAAERLGRRIVAHRRPAPIATKRIDAGLLNRQWFRIAMVRIFRAAVAAEEILIVQTTAADLAADIGKWLAHRLLVIQVQVA